MAKVTLKLVAKLTFWAPWLIRLACFNHSIGIPVNPDAVADLIVRHTRIEATADG
jgi:hypothetical protein